MMDRVDLLKKKMLSQKRYVSIEQAEITTEIYRKYENEPVIVKRALALKAAMERLEIGVENEELIVGNRTRGVRYGVVSPEGGSSWISKEFRTLPSRPQDKFDVNEADIAVYENEIAPYWKGRSLEDVVHARYGDEISAISKVVKINQTDHAQGHICPDSRKWLTMGPAELRKEALQREKTAEGTKKAFYRAVSIVMSGAVRFIRRYAELMREKVKTETCADIRADMLLVARNCENIAKRPPSTFHEAVQSEWFLFVLLHMESNASSFSPGRMDQLFYPYYKRDLEHGILTESKAQDILNCLFLKFNEIVYLRNSGSAKYFAGFPIGFNIVIGGQNQDGSDSTNALSWLFLAAQRRLGLPQPNLSVRLHEGTPEDLLLAAVDVVSRGSGMPQFFNDNAVIPALTRLGISKEDALNYAVVGCVELTTQGNNLGWSDAAMFNLNKALELTMNHGLCLLTGKRLGPDFGGLDTFQSYEELEEAFKKTILYFLDRMVKACEVVEQAHIDLLPSPFLSSVIDDCMECGMDVTAGGAVYNLSGIQMIQLANVADSLAALKEFVYDEKRVDTKRLLAALRNNYEGEEPLRVFMLNRAPKYGNDVPWVDEIGAKWAGFFRRNLEQYTNYRGGRYHTGMYTVSAHVPMGENVGATPDGRRAREPLADGGMSPVYGRDVNGPTAVLKSVSRLPSEFASNGGLLNMKFLPEFFETETGRKKFAQMLRTFVDLKIPHVQFNVLRREDLLNAQKEPEKYRGLTVRVAGYTAYFTELADKLQNEIIARTSYGDI
ncbi:glycyl radical protein [Caproiciproducens sp. CPB-2]|uniref:glycyl radical protein n=1 Tax=Caproiciproducens sp. CPB-2 TaxID=3030017 RepID=UPI0023DC78A3|nr:formate C-acetyltransferase/glycerol dehydratase family glycyl radical enzyme [Caproiciproducens sp. CPB-2]MDF1494825.1 formate C-acetyltransferase/glycerol dehydratase family glycyl radical enzyme [Caproiciproducens sp. CPB-2]